MTPAPLKTQSPLKARPVYQQSNAPEPDHEPMLVRDRRLRNAALLLSALLVMALFIGALRQ